MFNDFKKWWNAVPANQKVGLIVLAAFVIAVLIFSFGVQIGSGVAKAL